MYFVGDRSPWIFWLRALEHVINVCVFMFILVFTRWSKQNIKKKLKKLWPMFGHWSFLHRILFICDVCAFGDVWCIVDIVDSATVCMINTLDRVCLSTEPNIMFSALHRTRRLSKLASCRSVYRHFSFDKSTISTNQRCWFWCFANKAHIASAPYNRRTTAKIC